MTGNTVTQGAGRGIKGAIWRALGIDAGLPPTEEEMLLEQKIETTVLTNQHLKQLFYETLTDFRKHYFNGQASTYGQVEKSLGLILYRGLLAYTEANFDNKLLREHVANHYGPSILFGDEFEAYREAVIGRCKEIVERANPSDVDIVTVNSFATQQS